MKHKLSLVISLYFLIVLLFIGGFTKSKRAQLKALENAPDKGQCSWYIRQAKIKGEKEVGLPGWIVCPPDVLDLNDALSQFRVIIAKPIERYSAFDTSWGIVTWNKFKVIEDLSSRRMDKEKQYGCCGCDNDSDCTASFPAALLPLESDEILLPHIGGNLLIDGIKVIQPSVIPVDFATGTELENMLMRIPTGDTPEARQAHQRLENTDQYLLFAYISKFGKTGNLSGGRGIFSLNAAGELRPLGTMFNIINPWLVNLQINSLDKLKTYIEQM